MLVHFYWDQQTTKPLDECLVSDGCCYTSILKDWRYRSVTLEVCIKRRILGKHGKKDYKLTLNNEGFMVMVMVLYLKVYDINFLKLTKTFYLFFSSQILHQVFCINYYSNRDSYLVRGDTYRRMSMPISSAMRE